MSQWRKNQQQQDYHEEQDEEEDEEVEVVKLDSPAKRMVVNMPTDRSVGLELDFSVEVGTRDKERDFCPHCILHDVNRSSPRVAAVVVPRTRATLFLYYSYTTSNVLL